MVKRRSSSGGLRPAVAVAAAAVLTLVAAAPAEASAGDLDPGFGTGGKVITDLGGVGDFAHGAALQPDGKIVVAGASGPNTGGRFTVVRYGTDGNLDRSFGRAGKVRTEFGRTDEIAIGVAVQPDGKIVAAGSAGEGYQSHHDFALARYEPDGTPDTSFGGDGKVTTDFGGPFDLASAVVVQPDGKIVAAGFGSRIRSRHEFALARYGADGVLDPTFGEGGTVTTPLGRFNDAGAFDLVLLPDGKLLAAGRGDYLPDGTMEFALARYQPDGSLDPTFGSGGVVTTNLDGYGATGAAVQPDGRIVVAGQVRLADHNAFLVARYLPDGAVDRSFGIEGVVTTDFGVGAGAEDVAVGPDGSIVAAGGAGGRFAVARYRPNGRPDPTFGDGGTVTTGFPGDSGFALAVLVQPNGGIVAVGAWIRVPAFDYDWAMARYRGGTTP
jgi:uncharacterized delta-60 repeat protein